MNRHGGRGGPMRNNGGGGRQAGRGFYGPQGGEPRQRMSGGQNRGMPMPRAVPSNVRSQPYPAGKPSNRPPQQPLRNSNTAPPKTDRQAPQQQPYMEHSFSLKHRTLVDHRVRNPHRRIGCPTLLRTIAHWVSFPALTNPVLTQHVPISLKTSPEDCLTAPEESTAETPTASGSTINVRAILCQGLKPNDRNSTVKSSVLKRITMLSKRAADGQLSCYGGHCDSTTQADAVAFLKEKIKKDTGLDLSEVKTWYKFFEIQYSDAGPTVFYLPALWELTEEGVMQGTAREVTSERTELIEQELSREGMTDEEFQQAKAELKPEEKIITEVKKVIESTPTATALPTLLHAELKRDYSRDTHEAHYACDALDEFIKRDMATKINRKLLFRETEANEAAVRKEQEAKDRDELKRKREEEEKEEKEKRQVKLEELKEKWEAEDQGKTDDEKREALIERKKIMSELEGTKDELEPTTADSRRYRTILDVDQECIDAFEFFDRPNNNPTHKPSGFVSRARLENLLMCIDDNLCMGDVEGRLSTTGKGYSVSYKMIYTTERRELIPDDVPEASPIEDAAMAEEDAEQSHEQDAAMAEDIPVAEEITEGEMAE